METEKEILDSLVAFNRPLEELVPLVWPLKFRYSAPITHITRQDIISVMNRYLAGEFDGDTLEFWADLVFDRLFYDVPTSGPLEMETNYTDAIDNVLEILTYEPERGHPHTPEFIRQLIDELENAKLDPVEA